jgi:uncharacterized protein
MVGMKTGPGLQVAREPYGARAARRMLRRPQPSAEKPASIFGRAMSDKPGVVLDTNVVLDWLVFRDPRVTALAQQIEQAEVNWIACPSMRAELARMLSHRSLLRWSPDGQQALAVFDRSTQTRPDPAAAGPTPLRCSDPDDQVFIDLALAEGALMLFTHDRALLKLARRARPLGLSIRAP